MSIPVFRPRRDVDLLAWSANFHEKVAAQPVDFGLTAAQATAFGALHDAFTAAAALATDPNTNSRANIIAKNEARERLVYANNGASALVKIVQAHPGTTNAMRGELGLRIVDEPVPTPAPHSPPGLSIVTTLGRVVKVRLRDRDHPEKRGKPAGVEGATVLYFPGEQPPEELSQWMFALNASKPVFDVEIPASVSAGEKVWLTAIWFNRKMQPSPPARPTSTRISEGLTRAA